MIEETDFSKLYNQDIDVFSIGYSVNDGVLVPYNYNNFLSEARLASFIAIAKGDVPFKHWFRLDKTLTKYKWYKGVVSWTGTMFEYYMPLIFMKSFKHTLLDETYLFAYYAHKEFIREVDPKLPWGITESAYNELDDSQNYKYKAFGIPYLKFHDSEIPSLVIAPYGSIMALARYPKEVIENINKFQKLGMEGEYGLYESYDHDDRAIVKSYYAHHQGMILSSITNYLKNDIIQEHFHNDKNIKSIEILLKEKVQIRAYINLQIAKYKKYNYERDVYDSDIREQEGIMPMPEVGVLSNGMYSTFINDRGIRI
jgi:cyclic beta-1,2-glucan synthetase